MRRTSSTTLALALIATVLWPASSRAAFIDSNLAANTLGGGCYPVSIAPGLLDMLTLINPEWTPINMSLNPVTIHGTVAFAKVNEGGDFPGDHVTDDENTFVTLDPADQDFVSTGNVGPEAVEDGQMEVEWEIGSYPLFAWPGTGDRFTAVGRWIWDCGHPSANPAGTCSVTMTQACVKDSDCAAPLCPACVPAETCLGVNFNYHSEVHPPQAVAVTRTGGYAYRRRVRRGRLSTRTDVWISPNGGGAGDACNLNHEASDLTLLSEECFPLSQPTADVNASDFAFDIPLPPRPPAQVRPPRIKVFDQTPIGLPQALVTATWVPGIQDQVHVVVHMTTPVNSQLPSRTGKTIVAGWSTDPTPVTKLRVKVTGIEIVNALKPVTPAVPSIGANPGWQMWFEVNGNWQQLTGLGFVQSPGTIAEDLKLNLGVPSTGGALHLHATGKSLGCSEQRLYGQSLATDLAAYGLVNGASCLTDTSKDIGAFDFTLSGPDFGSGGSSQSYVTQSVGGDGGHCSATTGSLCLVNADCPGGETCIETGGAFKLHYTITKL